MGDVMLLLGIVLHMLPFMRVNYRKAMIMRKETDRFSLSDSSSIGTPDIQKSVMVR